MPLDLGAGLLLGLLAEYLFDRPAGLVLPLTGALFTLLPDADFLIHLARARTVRHSEHHREMLHLPILYISIGLAAFLFFGEPWIFLFISTSVVHFLHDSIGIGWGVPWLYPFTDNAFSFFYHLENNNRKPKLPRRLLYVWYRDDISNIADTYGDDDWIRNVYGKLHPYAQIELFVFLVGLIAVAMSITHHVSW